MEQQTTGRNALRACIGILTAGVAASAAPAFADAPIIRTENPIAGQYIVVFEEGSNVPEMMQKMQAWSGAAPMMEYGEVLPGGAFEMTESQARLASKMPGVAYIEEDQKVFLAEVNQPNPRSYGLDQLTPGPGYRTAFSGKGVNIVVMDTGFAPVQVGRGYKQPRVIADLIRDGRNGADCNSHGTAVAGTALGSVTGVAPDADFSVVRIFSCEGQTSNAIVIGGFESVARDFRASGRPTLVNGSFSGGRSDASDQAATNLVNMGITTVIAAGNDGRDACLNSPARAAGVITVASNDQGLQRSGFSNFGQCVEIYAAGSAITTLALNGGERSISGTSFASPTVAGVAAQVIEEFQQRGVRNPTPAQVSARILELSVPGIRDARGPGRRAQSPGAR